MIRIILVAAPARSTLGQEVNLQEEAKSREDLQGRCRHLFQDDERGCENFQKEDLQVHRFPSQAQQGVSAQAYRVQNRFQEDENERKDREKEGGDRGQSRANSCQENVR